MNKAEIKKNRDLVSSVYRGVELTDRALRDKETKKFSVPSDYAVRITLLLEMIDPDNLEVTYSSSEEEGLSVIKIKWNFE